MERKFIIYLDRPIRQKILLLIGILFSPLILLGHTEIFNAGNMRTQQVKSDDKRRITGRVIDVNGEPLIGASVYVEGGTTGTFTDIDGYYSIDVKDDPNLILSFKYLGLEVKNIVIKSETIINMTLDNEIVALDQVIVTGYQTISRERAVGSFNIVSGKNIENKTQSNIMDRLEGMVSGLNTYGKTSDTGDTQLTIRGVSSLYANTKPLYVVDGVPYEGDINLINANDVVNVTVLKDATANSIYGAQAANGVIVITTRKGESGATSVRYSGSVRFAPKPDFEYLNLINSSDLIDLQIEGFNFEKSTRRDRVGYNPVIELLYQHREGKINASQLDERLMPYRGLDNRKQILDEFAKTSVVHQHNLSVSGGNDKNTYLLSLNYYGDSPNQKESNEWRVGINLKDNIKFTNWLKGDISVSANFSRENKLAGANSFVSGSLNYQSDYNFEDLITGYPSYYMLRDNAGNVIDLPAGKSSDEQARLLSLGLLNESYSPITNLREVKDNVESNYYRIQAGLNAEITKGLTADIKFQIETGQDESRLEFSAASKKVRSMINDAATYNKNTNILTLNVPKGGQLSREVGNHFSYTLRGQLNYVNDFDKHSIVALLGAERRLVHDRSNLDYYMGYDGESLELGYFNPLLLREVKGTEAISGKFNWDYADYAKLRDIENRYVSFYSNASYTYDQRYSFTGSIRIDQSNLFGTDPKYQYRPLWSLGGGWHLKQEQFMRNLNWIDRLSFRLTYGISGNVAKDVGPYLQFENRGVQYLTGESSILPDNPANKELRWEKTATTNVGTDMSFLNSRIQFSFDFYNKSTSDLLGFRPVNTLTGWNTVMINYGDMYNRGIELSLNTINVKNRNFTWDMGVNFSYNKNKLTDLRGGASYVTSFVSGSVATIGYPLSSLFSYRYAGLSDKGIALVYNKNGEMGQNVSSVDDLVFSGVRDPKYTGSLFNRFVFKDFELSFMLVYYGGHVLRNISAPILSSYPSANVHQSILNMWKKPGDELLDPNDSEKGLNPNVTPGFQQVNTTQYPLPWTSADKHVMKADYVKLRDVTLSYRVPKKLLQKAKLKSVTFTFQVNNLYTWTANDADIDPEAYALRGGNMGDNSSILKLPKPITYTLGTVINFRK